jgi:hypothetical protein
MALTGLVTGDATLVTVVLIVSLVALAVAVAEMREAQQLAAQSAAAQRAATQLRAASVRVRSQVLGDAGIEGGYPHTFRRTVATVINDQASVNLAAELLGHTDPKVTIERYIRRNEHVNPLTAELLDQAFGATPRNETSLETEFYQPDPTLARGGGIGHAIRGMTQPLMRGVGRSWAVVGFAVGRPESRPGFLLGAIDGGVVGGVEDGPNGWFLPAVDCQGEDVGPAVVA